MRCIIFPFASPFWPLEKSLVLPCVGFSFFFKKELVIFPLKKQTSNRNWIRIGPSLISNGPTLIRIGRSLFFSFHGSATGKVSVFVVLFVVAVRKISFFAFLGKFAESFWLPPFRSGKMGFSYRGLAAKKRSGFLVFWSCAVPSLKKNWLT